MKRIVQMSLQVKIFSGFTIICILWGSSWATVKLGLETVPPLLSLGIRFFIASSILGAIVVMRYRNIPKDKNFWRLMLIMCVTSVIVPYILIYWAQIQVNSGLAAVLFATFPLWVAILSHFILPNERITLFRILGMVFGFLGVILVFNNGFSDLNMKTLYGMIAIIIGAIMQAFGLVALRRFGEHMHPVTLNFWSMLTSTFILLPASFFMEDYSHILFNGKTVVSLMYLSICCTACAFVIYFWLVKHMEAIMLSLTAFITPVIAVIIAIILMGEEFTTMMYIGSLLVLVGIAVAILGDFVTLYRRRKIKY